MQEQGAIVTELPEAERIRWVNGLPDLAGDWVKRNTDAGLPAADALEAFLNGGRERGSKPLRDWSNWFAAERRYRSRIIPPRFGRAGTRRPVLSRHIRVGRRERNSAVLRADDPDLRGGFCARFLP
ncbi:MAG: hypothetical protein OXI87_21935 [Albidovulum sp.]|nr:hypothetical protein [Albidovulum sp.]